MMKAATLSPPRRRLLAIGAAFGLVVLGGAGLLLLREVAPAVRFVEYRMPGPHDGPMAIAAAADGTVWFTIDQADAIGRVRGGRIELLPTPGRNYERLPCGLASELCESGPGAAHSFVNATSCVGFAALRKAAYWTQNREV